MPPLDIQAVGECVGTGRLPPSMSARDLNPRNADLALAEVEAPDRMLRGAEADPGLEGLAATIRARGLIQPLLVRPSPEGTGYELVVGRRRWRAAALAGLKEVPAVVVDVDEAGAIELSLVENVQRTDLNPIEEAQAFASLTTEYGYSQYEVAVLVGKSRSHVSNTLRLLRLPDAVQDMVAGGVLSAGHARAITYHEDPAGVARQIVDGGLNVRQAEALADRAGSAPDKGRRGGARHSGRDGLARVLEKELGVPVTIEHRGPGGVVRLAYEDPAQLKSLCERIASGARQSPAKADRSASASGSA